MSRRIQTDSVGSFGPGGPGIADTYFDKVVKFIPADIVGAWVAVSGLISSAAQAPRAILWIAFAATLLLTPLWMWKQTQEPGKPPATTQIVVATGAFAVWVFALGGPFATLDFYLPLYGSLVLIFYTLAVGVVNPKE